MKRRAQAIWKGNGMEGQGTLSSQSGAFDAMPYSFVSRFKNEDGQQGTNPEELIAAAHAGCFAMALSFQLAGAGYTADTLDTKAVLTMEKQEGWVITSVDLNLTATVPGIADDEFQKLATHAKENCPVSNVLNCEINLVAKLA